MVIQNIFNIGQTVYLKTDPDQHPHILTGLRVYKEGIMYEVSFMGNVAVLSDFEISEEKNILAICGINEKQNS